MKEDRAYCISSFLMLRTIYGHNKTFKNNIMPKFFEENSDRENVSNSYELENKLKKQIEKIIHDGKKVALALSGGIDSAVLAKFMPKNSIAYTFKCIVPGIEVTDESTTAEKYAKECNLKHKIIEIYWDDFKKFAPVLMKHKGAPIHSIEVQIYKAAMEAKKDGIEVLIFGESADVNFGGQDGLLSKDWTISEYIDRYSYLLPYKAVKEPIIINEPFLKYSNNGYINAHEFNRHAYYCETMGSYTNAMETANVEFCAPFSKTYLAVPLDYDRVRNGQNKYMIREIFERLYPKFIIPPKTPMPRPMNEWLKDWNGPIRNEFLPNCHKNMTGDQKWLIWALETFLNMIDEEI